ncbi:MAG: Hsp33 family molecular chaperone HslO [Legionellales bacterium]|nr:Hsp33 family molecular chaperone HslO [Legionellales bacterium]
MSQTDYLQRFLFEHHAIRGELVFLRDVFQTITTQRDYPPEVKTLLGHAIAATALLSATIKYNGSLILQAQTTGPVNLLVTQCDQNLNMRALAKWQDDAHFAHRILGDGQMVITISPDNTTERYQGVINLSSDRLNENLESYFERSEQLPTRLWLAANQNQAVGLLIQKMPSLNQGEQAAGTEWEYWEHLHILANTITETELLSLDAMNILHRLFHEEDIRLYEEEPVTFKCKCDKHKMIQALKTMSEAEIRDILRTHHVVEITCDFCNNHYAFNTQDVDEIFSGGI